MTKEIEHSSTLPSPEKAKQPWFLKVPESHKLKQILEPTDGRQPLIEIWELMAQRQHPYAQSTVFKQFLDQVQSGVDPCQFSAHKSVADQQLDQELVIQFLLGNHNHHQVKKFKHYLVELAANAQVLLVSESRKYSLSHFLSSYLQQLEYYLLPDSRYLAATAVFTHDSAKTVIEKPIDQLPAARAVSNLPSNAELSWAMYPPSKFVTSEPDDGAKQPARFADMLPLPLEILRLVAEQNGLRLLKRPNGRSRSSSQIQPIFPGTSAEDLAQVDQQLSRITTQAERTTPEIEQPASPIFLKERTKRSPEQIEQSLFWLTTYALQFSWDSLAELYRAAEVFEVNTFLPNLSEISEIQTFSATEFLDVAQFLFDDLEVFSDNSSQPPENFGQIVESIREQVSQYENCEDFIKQMKILQFGPHWTITANSRQKLNAILSFFGSHLPI